MKPAANALTQSRCQRCRSDSAIKSTFAQRVRDSVVVRMRLQGQFLFEVRNEKLQLAWLYNLFQNPRAKLTVLERLMRVNANDNHLHLDSDKKFHPQKYLDNDTDLRFDTLLEAVVILRSARLHDSVMEVEHLDRVSDRKRSQSLMFRENETQKS